MKSITIAGKLGRDAETRAVGSDTVTSFSVAVDSREKVNGQWEKVTTWFDASMWGKRGETLAKFLTKGSAVCVSGDFGTRTYQAKDGSTKTSPTVRVDQVTLLGGGQRDGQRPDSRGNGQSRGNAGGYQGNTDGDEFNDNDAF